MEKKGKILPFDESYIIHLSNEQGRYDKMTRELADVDILDEVKVWWTVKRPISVTVGNEMPLMHTEYYDNIRNSANDIYGNVFNCSYEHYQIIKNAYNRGLNSVFVMEDDISFKCNWEYLKFVMDNIPNDYDIIKFYYLETDNMDTYKSIYGNNSELFIDITNNPRVGNVCYALNHKGMEEYLKYNENGLRVSDMFYDNAGRNGCKIYGINYSKGILNIKDILYVPSTITNGKIEVKQNNNIIKKNNKVIANKARELFR